jgi:hypothetical protein
MDLWWPQRGMGYRPLFVRGTSLSEKQGFLRNED